MKSVRLLGVFEKPAYKEIGQALQLHKLLRDDPIIKSLKKALYEDVSEHGAGLSMESRQLVQKILGDENVGVRLTKGPKSQRTRIYDKLGYTFGKDVSLKLLRFLPDVDKAVRSEANIKQQLDLESDPSKRSSLQDGLFKAQELRQKYQDIHDQVKGARKYAADMAQTEADPKRKAFYESMNEKINSTPSPGADAKDRLTRLNTALETENDPAKRTQLQTGIYNLQRQLPESLNQFLETRVRIIPTIDTIRF